MIHWAPLALSLSAHFCISNFISVTSHSPRTPCTFYGHRFLWIIEGLVCLGSAAGREVIIWLRIIDRITQHFFPIEDRRSCDLALSLDLESPPGSMDYSDLWTIRLHINLNLWISRAAGHMDFLYFNMGYSIICYFHVVMFATILERGIPSL